MATKIIKTTFQLRRGEASWYAQHNPVLNQGEPAFEIDTKRLKIGDGHTAYNSLPYFESGVQVKNVEFNSETHVLSITPVNGEEVYYDLDNYFVKTNGDSEIDGDLHISGTLLNLGGIAIGDISNLENDCSLIMGVETHTSNSYQFVGGQYNKLNPDATFIIGNGIDDNNRSNSFEALEDGSLNVKGLTIIKDDNNITWQQSDVIQTPDPNNRYKTSKSTLNAMPTKFLIKNISTTLEDEKYKIKLSIGKDIIPINDNPSYSSNFVVNKYFLTTGATGDNNNFSLCTSYIPVQNNSEYYIKIDNNLLSTNPGIILIGFYIKSGNAAASNMVPHGNNNEDSFTTTKRLGFSTITSTNNICTFTIPSECHYIRCAYSKNLLSNEATSLNSNFNFTFEQTPVSLLPCDLEYYYNEELELEQATNNIEFNALTGEVKIPNEENLFVKTKPNLILKQGQNIIYSKIGNIDISYKLDLNSIYQNEIIKKYEKPNTGIPTSDIANYSITNNKLSNEVLEQFYKIYPTETKTNLDLISTDIAADNIPFQELIISIGCNQEGIGDPSPTNIRSISKTTGLNLYISPTTESSASGAISHFIDLSSTSNDIYLAQLNILTGELKIMGQKYTIGSNQLNFYAKLGEYTNGIIYYAQVENTYNNPFSPSLRTLITSNIFKYANQTNLQSLQPWQFGYRNGTINHFFMFPNDEAYDSVDKVRTWAIENPIDVILPFNSNNIIIEQLSPIEVKSILSNMNIWHTSGTIASATYRLDPTLAYNKIKLEITT